MYAVSGTTDDKINLISILEAAEKLLKENFEAGTHHLLSCSDMTKKLGGKEWR
jgi:acetylornithine deacetylase/succinyl-diaminopimelate desuccinylase-like protein